MLIPNWCCTPSRRCTALSSTNSAPTPGRLTSTATHLCCSRAADPSTWRRRQNCDYTTMTTLTMTIVTMTTLTVLNMAQVAMIASRQMVWSYASVTCARHPLCELEGCNPMRHGLQPHVPGACATPCTSSRGRASARAGSGRTAGPAGTGTVRTTSGCWSGSVLEVAFRGGKGRPTGRAFSVWSHGSAWPICSTRTYCGS